MKKYFLLVVFGLSASFFGSAQEYKIKRNTGRLKLSLGSVTVIGYDGNEIIIKKNGNNAEVDIRANGLRRLGVSGYEVSPGFGITAVEKEDVVEIEQMYNKLNVGLVLMVPMSMSVSLINTNVITAGPVKFVNMMGEIEIKADYSPVELEDISGPLTAFTIAEPIKANFGNIIKGPVSINSISGRIEVSITDKTPLNFNINSVSGKIFLDNSISSNFLEADDNRGNAVKGKFKGGGEKLHIITVSSHIYLRKK